MDKARYLILRKELASKGPNDAHAWLLMLIFSALTVGGICLSLHSWAMWPIGQLLLIISFFQGQTLVHELGHGFFFSSRKLNAFVGHIVSLSPILPFIPWTLIHGQHHRWTGNKQQDPTMVAKKYQEVPEQKKKIMNLLWKSWIPVFVLSYSFGNFWNYKKLKMLFPQHAIKCLFSIIFTIAAFGLMVLWTGPERFLRVWGVAYFFFLMLAEPLLLSQHVHIDQGEQSDPEYHSTKSYAPWEQDEFSRTVIFPSWVRRYILINFNLHGNHHLFPNLPGYYLDQILDPSPHTIPWHVWYRQCKETDAATLLLLTHHDTGLPLGR